MEEAKDIFNLIQKHRKSGIRSRPAGVVVSDADCSAVGSGGFRIPPYRNFTNSKILSTCRRGECQLRCPHRHLTMAQKLRVSSPKALVYLNSARAPLRVKRYIEDVSNELYSGVNGFTSRMKFPEFYCSR
ncbi:hypothetical protein TNCV_3477901 [Trichonephila clavipes]|nr:hypothetical protein TNCV_3477901 [Trichonephila clavipes]